MGLLPDSSDFSIILYKKILCKLCHNFSNLEEPSLFCILKNPSKKEIEEKLKNLEEEKEYKGGNLLYCENCSANREMVMSTFGINIPNIFVFYIGNVLGKRAQGAYNFFYCGDKFELYGVICYYNSGCRHYIAYTLDNAEWMQYNDDHISYSSPDFEHAYMLFYKKT
ncbi:unnamed protein product [Blepharisma stoltei]|nr:unnamed protein product [Blepharisma stoltei]